MRVLILHNKYRIPGGEDSVVHAEAEMLAANGVTTKLLEVENPQDDGLATAQIVLASSWSRSAFKQIVSVCAEFRPDIAHVHNFWMALSPAVHAACHSRGVATVQTLHNFRLFCTNSLFLRDGAVCEECLGHLPWRGITRRCYRGSLMASTACASMMVYNRLRRTWDRDVDAFIALSSHSREKFIRGGLPANRIFVKPNFTHQGSHSADPPSRSRLVVYAGRLSPEKGLMTLLEAWRLLNAPSDSCLLLAGEGPERDQLERFVAAAGLSNRVGFLGFRPPAEIQSIIAKARAVVAPSICFENFPSIVSEAYACGRPVIVSDIGALREIVPHGITGLRCAPGNPAELANALTTLLNSPDVADSMGSAAGREYRAKYTPARNFALLSGIYDSALMRNGGLSDRSACVAGNP